MAFPIEAAPKLQSSLTALNTSFSSSGDNIAIAAKPNQIIAVHALALTFASAVDVTVKAGATTAGVYQAITSIVLDPLMGHPRFVTGAGEAFTVNLGSGVQCKGTIWYVQGPLS